MGKATRDGYHQVKSKRYRRFRGRNAVAKKALMKANMALKQIKEDIELKYSRLLTTTTPVQPTPSFTNLSGVIRGNAANQRLGDKVTGKYLNMRYTVTTNPANNNFVRIIIFEWEGGRNGGVPPTSGDILEASNVTSPYKFNPPERFRILYDNFHAVSLQGTPNLVEKETIPLKDREYTWINLTGAANDYGYRQIWLMTMSDANVVGAAPTVSVDTRFVFMDG